MYLEFFLLISDYFKTINRRLFIYELLFPILIGISVWGLLYFGTNTKCLGEFRNNTIALLGVLVGFSITIITILTTSSSKNVDEIKIKKTDYKIGGKVQSLYNVLLINFTYSVVVEVVLIIINLIYPIILANFTVNQNVKIVGFAVVFCSIMHVLLLTIRNITDFYLTLSK